MLNLIRRGLFQARARDPRFLSLLQEPEDEWVSLDCETTSLNPDRAELLSIGAVRIQGNRILSSQALSLLVKPAKNPEGDNIKIHGLRARDVNQGMDPVEAVSQLLDFIGGRALLGYYLEYDLKILNKYLKPILGAGLPNRRVEVSACYYDYRAKQYPDSNIDLRLATLLEVMNVPTLPRHEALNDAITVAMLFMTLKQRGFAS
jgi:DNA polymerase-3 subunit epsilon